MPTDYEHLAARYDEDRAKWSFTRDDILEELVASRPRVRVLDLGCGTGRWLEAQQDYFGAPRLHWLGADPSAAMLAEARAKGIANLIRAGAEGLPLRDATIDYLATSYTFHHFTDKDRALDEIARVLTRGGVFRLTNIEPTVAEGWWLYEYFPEAIALDAARFWPPDRVAAALETRHFTVEIELSSGTDVIPAAEALVDAERRVVSQLAQLADDAHARGLARLRQVAAPASATVTTTRSRLCLTARRAG